MATWDIPKELGSFYADYITVPLYIMWDQFITFQVTRKTPYHWVTLKFMLDLKRLDHNLLNILYVL